MLFQFIAAPVKKAEADIKDVSMKDLNSIVESARKKDQTVIAYFHANWCGPCEKFTPLVKEFYNQLHNEKKDKYVFLKIDISEENQKDAAVDRGYVVGMPTVLSFHAKGRGMTPSKKGTGADQDLRKLLPD
jgi:thiol-disulfide isomerase/thioredoxin